MIFDWFDASQAVAFAKDVARDIDKLYQRDAFTEKKTHNGKAARKGGQRLESLVLRVQVFSRQNKLNVYKKAKLLNTVKWELREAGHDQALVDDAVNLLARLLK